MESIFEVKYISIKWDDLSSIRNIRESAFPIKIDIVDEDNYFLELQTYTRIENGEDGQVAFHIHDNSSDVVPVLIDASNNQIPLLKIQNPQTKKNWWIENGSWNKKRKYRESNLWNHVGRTQVKFGSIRCDIHVRAISFSVEELSEYLNDFKNDFWALIYKPNSFVSGDAKQKEIKFLNDKTLNLISKFIDYTTKILANPKKELKEVQTLKDRKEVRPVAKTYMEIATKGISKKLTSRDYTESYDVAENRYICYITNKVYSMSLQILNALDHEYKFIANNQLYQKKRLDLFSKTKKINKRVFENDLKQLEEMIKKDKDNLLQSLKRQDQDDDLLTIKNKIDEIKQFPIKIKEALTSQPKINNDMVKIQTLTIRLERKQNDYLGKVQFKASVSYMNNEIFTSESNTIIIISFAKSLFDRVFEEGDSYTISGVVNESKYPTRYGNIIYNIFFANVIEVKAYIEYCEIIIRLRKKTYEDKKYTYFNGDVMMGDGFWFQHKENDFYSFKFHKSVFSNVLKTNNTYKIKCCMSKNIKEWSKNNREGYIHEIIFEYIEDIQTMDSALEKKLIKEKETFLRLESLGWQMDMSPQELVKQNHEKDTIDKSLDDLTKQNTEITKHKKELLKKITLIKKLIDRFKALKIKEDCSFPNSMTFIQNPNYQGSKKVFTSFLETIGIEEDMFKSLLLVDQIGLIDLPALYEKWCLLQIIKVLIEEYHFIPDQNWKKTLVSQVLTIKHNVKINFFNDVIARDVILGYEEELKSKKRPDFVLMIKSKITETTKKFIMDAKFKEDVDIRGLMQELYHDKNYSEDRKNKVFILHPDVNNKIDNLSNPQSWADQSYYGETQLMNYDWDKDDPECKYVEVLPNHRYGAILLSPFDRSAISEGGYLDNLKRLIAMFLQYGMEDNKKLASNDGKIDSMTKEKPFCTLCGSSNLYIKRFTPRSGVGYGYEVTCKDSERVKQIETSLLKNKTTNGLFWQPIM